MKTQKSNLICSFIIVLTLISSCREREPETDLGIDLESEKREVANVVNKFAEAWETENVQLLSEIMLHDSNMVNYGTDAGEVFIGWDNFKMGVEQMLPMFDSITITVTDQIINVDSTGTFAWFSQIWDWRLKVQGQPMEMNGQRFTGVLKKMEDRWVIAQFHNSVPVKTE